MIDRYLLPVQQVILVAPARKLTSLGMTADQMTLAGFGAAVLALLSLALGWTQTGLVVIVLNRVMDGLDGAMARLAGPTDRGAFLDIACDFLFYAFVPLGFALADPARNALPAAVLLTSFVGTGSSFLAFASVAAKNGLATKDYPAKGIYYLSGMTEGAETIALFLAMCIWPHAFPWLALMFAFACALTTAMRWRMGWQTFTPNFPQDRSYKER